ncbi:co-chaperone YbbN [Utexia brackfieldae]|uniref:co-chaperone YbbN n=1 Tax=Utexia brackfieldae TaxID=3074108 RepID=UPI00370D3650
MQNSSIIDVNEQNVQQLLVESKTVPVVFYFWSDRSPQCQALTVLLTRLANEYSGQFILAKLNCDEQSMLAGQFGLRAIPTVYVFQNGQPVDGVEGPQPEEVIRQLLQQVLPNQDEIKLSEAKALLEEGAFEQALSLLKEVQQQLLTPVGKTRTDINLLLAKVLIELKQIESAELILLQIPMQDQDTEYQSLVANIELLKQAADSPEITLLQQQLMQEPENTELMVQLASQLHQVGRNEEALAILFKPLQTDLAVGEGQIKKALMDMLAALGTSNPLAASYRRKLYSLLY